MTPNSSVPPPDPAQAAEPAVWEALRQVIDPEIGLNLVDLGLIYSVAIAAGEVRITMTVTTPGCPLEHSLTFGVETAVLAVEGVRAVQVQVVHAPPWNPSLMSPAGRAATGIR